MATKRTFPKHEIRNTSKYFSRLRTIVETPFYGNNVVEIKTLQQAYNLAKKSPGTVITDLPVEQPELLGLRSDTKVLLFNDGSVTGRSAAARRIVGDEGVDPADLDKKVMDAVYDTRYEVMYHAQAVVGLDEKFMVRAHLLIPEGEENILYDWLLNFQILNKEYRARYENSTLLPEADIYVFSDPKWQHEDHPLGLTYFDSEHNCAALLGMKYFGEHKKGTLTLAWSIANRNGYACCHGGAKTYHRVGKENFTLAVFGLSGSGKSTLTHAKHDGKYDIEVLHDDAFIIHTEEKYAVALEPSYFDKTQDYPPDSKDNKYLLTVQNVGATLDDEGKIVPVTEDLRNGNGRAIKSKIWAPNRVDLLTDKISAVAWIMKDPVLPPVMKVENPVLASLMGATLSTKRTSAERLAKGVDMSKLVIEPYANPFRTYPLKDDYEKFLELFNTGVDCYILNTGAFLDKDVPKELTIEALELLIEEKADFIPFSNLSGFQYLPFDDFPVPETEEYAEAVRSAFQTRLDYLESVRSFNRLPEEAVESLKKLIK